MRQRKSQRRLRKQFLNELDLKTVIKIKIPAYISRSFYLGDKRKPKRLFAETKAFFCIDKLCFL